MTTTDFDRFTKAAMVLCPLALVIASAASPPDPITLLVYGVPLVLGALLTAYLLAYRGGLEALEATFTRQ